MTINKLYISTVDYSWAKHSSRLLNAKNLDTAITSTGVEDYHTSIEDLETRNLYKALQAATELILVDVDLQYIASLKDPSQVYNFGRLLNELCRNFPKLSNQTTLTDLNLATVDNRFAHRNTQMPVLWTAGCSFTAGTAVNWDQRWGSILSQQLQLPEISLSKKGASITWAADQILTADINAGDTVVWGLTTVPRADYARSWKLETNSLPGILWHKSEVVLPNDLDYYTSLTHVLHCIRSIMQVINFCKKVGVELYIVNFLEVTWVPIIFKDWKNFLDIAKDYPIDSECDSPVWIDYAPDNLHPGPLQHEEYAELIFNFIKGKNNGKTI